MMQMNRRQFLAGAAAVLAAGATHAQQPARKPNIVFFLADDMGWRDSSAYGSTFYETPALDKLVRQGMRFTNAYAAPLCSPTRAALMSGQYPERLGFTSAAGHVPREIEPKLAETAPPQMKVRTPSSKSYLPQEVYTYAEALRDAGYAAGHFGKWHLGGLPKHWAAAQGFERVFGGTGAPGPVGFFSPYFMENIEDGPDGEHIDARLAREVGGFIEAHREEPFLANVWLYDVHGPWQAPEEHIAAFEEKVDPNAPHRNPTYAGMLKAMDDAVGAVMRKLDEVGVSDNTLLVFMSDNGGLLHTETWDAHEPPYTYITSNAPLRGGKGTIHEGGIRVPLVVRWPGVVPEGTVCETPVHAVDFYPTFLDAAGVALPEQKFDGESLLPLLKQSGAIEREAIFGHFPFYMWEEKTRLRTWENLPASYVHRGDWKLVRLYGEGSELQPKDVLYNLVEDVGETRDVSADHPGLAAELGALLDAHLADTGAILPEPNTDYVPPVQEWRVADAAEMKIENGVMRVEATGMGARVAGPFFSMPGPVVVRMRLRAPDAERSRWRSYAGRPKVFWRHVGQDGPENQHAVFDIDYTGEWQTVEVPLTTEGTIEQIFLNIGYPPKWIEFDWIEVAYTGRYYEGYDTTKRWDFK